MRVILFESEARRPNLIWALGSSRVDVKSLISRLSNRRKRNETKTREFQTRFLFYAFSTLVSLALTAVAEAQFYVSFLDLTAVSEAKVNAALLALAAQPKD